MRNEENAEIRNIALILKKPHSYPCIMMIIPALEDIISCVHMQNAYIIYIYAHSIYVHYPTINLMLKTLQYSLKTIIKTP